MATGSRERKSDEVQSSLKGVILNLTGGPISESELQSASIR